MSDGLRHAIATGEYRIDPHAVAAAMIDRARAARAARADLCSEVLVAGDSIEIRRASSGECQSSLPLEGAA